MGDREIGKFIRRYGVDHPGSRVKGEALCIEYGVDANVVHEVLEYNDRLVFKSYALKLVTVSAQPGRYWLDDLPVVETTLYARYIDESTGHIATAPDIVVFT